MFRSLLIALDLSASSGRVLGRVALLPLAAGARLTLLHVVPSRLPRGAQKRVEKDARAALDAEAERLSGQLPEGVTVRSVVTSGGAATEIAERAAAVKAELIVLGRGGRRVRDFFLGSTAERVLRQARLPVLVVRLAPRFPYRAPAVAVDFDEAAHEGIAGVLRMVPPPRPAIVVIHAYTAPFQGLVYPSLSPEELEQCREQLRHQAMGELAQLLATAPVGAELSSGEAPTWRAHVRHGAPRSTVEKAVKHSGTDLLVLGTHGHSGLAQAFLGTVAGDVLREVACDVLMVPPRARRSGRAADPSRVRSSQAR